MYKMIRHTRPCAAKSGRGQACFLAGLIQGSSLFFVFMAKKAPLENGDFKMIISHAT